MCLVCGYVKKGQSDNTREDIQHLRRCDFHMEIRYATKHGITGGARRDRNGRSR